MGDRFLYRQGGPCRCRGERPVRWMSGCACFVLRGWRRELFGVVPGVRGEPEDRVQVAGAVSGRGSGGAGGPAEGGRYDIWYGPIRLAGIDHRGRLTRHDRAPPQPVDLMDNAAALPTTPQAQQPQSWT